MKLYAAGFNAWYQLDFDHPPDGEVEPDDIDPFQVVLDGDDLGAPVSKLAATVVFKDGAIKKAGSGIPRGYEQDCLDYAPACSALGEMLIADAASDGQITGQLSRFKNLGTYKENNASHRWPYKKAVKQIAAFDVGWVILHADGTVATLGDPRYGDCLGRDITIDRPADCPHEVVDLTDLGGPVVKVAAGGYTAAALTESGSVYAWGMSSPGTHRQQGIPDLNGVPNYVDIGDSSDIEDMAIGDSHAIALTTKGTVWVIGGNTNGQLGLGLGEGHAHGVKIWTKVDLSLAEGQRAVKVAAGPRASFIVVADAPNKI